MGATLTDFARAGKHIILALSTGQYLLNHLMLGGAIFCGTDAEAPDRTFQVVLRLDSGRGLYWSGLRLGWLHLLTDAELAARLGDLGVDPLSPVFTLDHLQGLLKGRRGDLKPLLLDQKRFPGIGNCYSDAVRLGGYPETPFTADDRFTGGYLPHLKVYDRQGQPCPRCGMAIELEEAHGRKMFHCPRCQPPVVGILDPKGVAPLESAHVPGIS